MKTKLTIRQKWSKNGPFISSMTPYCKQLNDQNNALKRNIFLPELKTEKALSCHCKSFKLSTRRSFDRCKNAFYFYFAPSSFQNYLFFFFKQNSFSSV